MRLLQISEDPRAAVGGVPQYVVAAVRELARQGERIDYLFSGGPSDDYDWTFRRRWRSWSDAGVQYHGLVNARSIGVHGGHPDLDVRNDDARLLVKRVAALRPDVVHVHSLLAIPLEALVGFARTAPVVVSVHEFGLICQRRVLIQRDGSICETYPSQMDCPGCVDVVDPALHRFRARLRHTPRGVGLCAAHAAERAVRREVPIARAPSSATLSPESVLPFRRRLDETLAIVARSVTTVLAVSTSVRDTLLRAGIDPKLVRVMHIGGGSADAITRLPLPSSNGAPVSFLYLGGVIPTKGVHVLVDAVRTLESPPRVVVAGCRGDGYEADLRARAPDSVEFRPRYSPSDLRELLGEADVVVVPSVGPETSPQVTLEALAAGRPVIGSAIGGIPDFVRHGTNGALVPPGDVAALSVALSDMRDPERVQGLAANARNPKPLAEHARELRELYAGLRLNATCRWPRVKAG